MSIKVAYDAVPCIFSPAALADIIPALIELPLTLPNACNEPTGNGFIIAGVLAPKPIPTLSTEAYIVLEIVSLSILKGSKAVEAASCIKIKSSSLPP